MNPVEKTKYLETLHNYLEHHKVYTIFGDLMESLMLSCPENPIDFLLERLSNPQGTINKQNDTSS
jgi:adenylate kinase